MSKRIRLLVTGDRYWTDALIVREMIETIAPDMVIEGEAKGADSIARDAAMELGIEVTGFHANWTKYRRAAGPIRNQRMLDEGAPTHVLAFHNDIASSKGTRDMVTRALRRGIPVCLVYNRKGGTYRANLKTVDDLLKLSMGGR